MSEPSQIHGNGHWLVCEMAFRIYDHDDMVIIPYKNKVLRIFISLKGGRGGSKKSLVGHGKEY